MKLLIVSATEAELAPTLKGAKVVPGLPHRLHETSNNIVDVIVCGVGAQATIFHLTRLLSTSPYDLLLQVGIAGAIDKEIKIGDTVLVKCDRFAQLGAEGEHGFMDIFEMGLANENTFPFQNGWLQPENTGYENVSNLKIVTAISVDTVHGKAESIEQIQLKYPAQIESMEGAAFFYCCMQMQIPCLQLRSISNYVEKRNKANWNISLAVSELNIKLTLIIDTLLS